MLLHIYIAGNQRFTAHVPPGDVERTLQLVNERMGDLSQQARVCVTLDSERHENVTYLLNRGN